LGFNTGLNIGWRYYGHGKGTDQIMIVVCRHTEHTKILAFVLDAGVALNHICSAQLTASTGRCHDGLAESNSCLPADAFCQDGHTAEQLEGPPHALTSQQQEIVRIPNAAHQKIPQPMNPNNVFCADTKKSGDGGIRPDTASMLASQLQRQFQLLWAEVTQYNSSLASKPCVIIVNKADLFEGSLRNTLQDAIRCLKSQVALENALIDHSNPHWKVCDILVTSAVLGWGIDHAQQKLQKMMASQTGEGNWERCAN
jgi:hypothetical protein